MVDRGEKLTKLLVQNRSEPLDISEQTIFLYAALNGFLDVIPLNYVNIYEKELYKFLRNTIFYEPLKIVLRDNLDIELINFLLENFNNYFLCDTNVLSNVAHKRANQSAMASTVCAALSTGSLHNQKTAAPVPTENSFENSHIIVDSYMKSPG